MNYNSFNEVPLKGIDDKLAAGVEPAVFCGEEAMKRIETIREEASQNQTEKSILHIVEKNILNQSNPIRGMEKEVNPLSGNTGIQVCSPMPNDEASEIIQKMNQEYAVVQIGNQVCILREIQQNGKLSIHYLNQESFKLLLANQKFVLKESNHSHFVKVADFWLEHEQRRNYDGIIFDPRSQDPRFYNLWKGFAVEPREGDCSLYLNHIRENICSGNQEYFDYLLDWMAHAIQKTYERPETAIVLRGGQGTGKGVFVKFFGELFGDHYLQINQSSHLVGKFNSHLQNRIVLFADEAFWAGDKQGENVLKGLITEPNNVIEMKHRDPIQIPNLIHLILASNDAWVVPASVDDRRYLVLDVSDAQKQNTEFFAKIAEQMNHGGREALLHFLQKRDIANVNLRKIPQTDALLDQKILSLEPVEQFWYERLQEGVLHPDHNVWENSMLSETLYQFYCAQNQLAGIRRNNWKGEFGKQLRKMCSKLKEQKLTINDYGKKRMNHYTMPSLDTCRSLFEKYIGMKIQWFSNEEEEEICSIPDYSNLDDDNPDSQGRYIVDEDEDDF